MKELPYRKLFVFIGILSVISLGIYCSISKWTGSKYFDFLAWNLFLAWLPYFISMAAYEVNRRFIYTGMTFVIAALGIVWLLLFPNSPYIITDLIHLTLMKQTYVVKGTLNFNYWFDFIMILIFAWNGFLLGFVSTYQFQFILWKRTNLFVSWVFVLLASVLGGYGILLGREYRLNSWDLVTVFTSMEALIADSMTTNALVFCCLFGLAITIIYTTFYFLINHTREAKS
jgi:uncharacterized membrane protein